SWKLSPRRRTSTGCRIPSSRTEAVSDASDSSSKYCRGCRPLACTAVRGISRRFEPRSTTTSVGMRAPRPLPNPLRRATTHLLRQLPVGDRTPGRGIEHDDRLSERRRLRQPYRPGHDVPTYLGAEMGAHLARHLLGEL